VCVKEKKKKKRIIFFLFLILNFPPLTAVRLFSDAYRRRKRIERSDGTTHTKVSTASLSNIGSIPILLAFFSYFSLSPSYIYTGGQVLYTFVSGEGMVLDREDRFPSTRPPLVVVVPPLLDLFFFVLLLTKFFPTRKHLPCCCCALALCAKSK
jgi:hypothetical protein